MDLPFQALRVEIQVAPKFRFKAPYNRVGFVAGQVGKPIINGGDGAVAFAANAAMFKSLSRQRLE